MTLRVLHIGNIANNAFNIAKGLREKADIEADVFTHGYKHFISQPEWEDADIDSVRIDEEETPDWNEVDLKGYQRPEWYFEEYCDRQKHRLASKPPHALLRFVHSLDASGDTRSMRQHVQRALDSDPLSLSQTDSELLHNLTVGRPTRLTRGVTEQDWYDHLLSEYRSRLEATLTPLTLRDIEETLNSQSDLKQLFKQYDIIQSYGVWEPMLPLLLTPSIPQITFEHGSMREHPFQPDRVGRLLALAYRKAYKNIITNADAIHSIRRLGLSNCMFIPHPVDDHKFRPNPSALREGLLAEHECTHIVFAPARHNWSLKGNDTVVNGFSKLLRKIGRGPKLFLSDWGQEMERTLELIREQNLEDAVVWVPPLPKRRLAAYINAADVVLDQFVLGSFGTTTPEAMACGKPVLLYYNGSDHQWCFPEPPPVCNAHTPDEICTTLYRLLTQPDHAAQIGESSRRWYQKHHSMERVIQSHLSLYKDVAASRSVVSIPYHFSQQYTKRLVMKNKVIAVVRCHDPIDSQGRSRYLTEIDGQTIIDILADRLNQIKTIRNVILVMETADSKTTKQARQCGWTVVHRNRRGLSDGVAGLRLAGSQQIALFSLQHPFVDPELFVELLSTMRTNGWNSLRLTGNASYGPTRILRSSLAARMLLTKAIMKGLDMPWSKVFSTVSSCASHMDITSPTDDLMTEGSYDLPQYMIQTMGGVGFSVSAMRQLEQEPETLRQVLLEEMKHSDAPHLVNAQLNNLECLSGIDDMASYPTFVGLNMTSICDAHCTFCSYSPKLQKFRDLITMDDLKEMTWLKYVSDFAIWGGVGDSLVNPNFTECYRYIKEIYPHLNVSFSTNGIKLTPEICDEFAGHLGSFNVSLNAATDETWQKVMRTKKGFENVCTMFSYLSRIKRERGLTRPTLTMSMVLSLDNITEAVQFVELAHKVGAEQVTFVHYVSTTLVGERVMSPEKSLYHDKATSDQWLDRAERRSAELNLQMTRPLPFNQKSNHIHYGSRVTYATPDCHDPWKTCYLTVDEDGRRQMIYCCSGYYYDATYEKEGLNDERFRKLWNHPAARYFRRTVNKPGANPICTSCQSEDRFDPDNASVYDIGAKVKPIFEKLNDKVLSHSINDEDIFLEHGALSPDHFDADK